MNVNPEYNCAERRDQVRITQDGEPIESETVADRARADMGYGPSR